jgi:2-hydroxy-3-keto-5-methylthiopentenyl-1-phosphate phosphatase
VLAKFDGYVSAFDETISLARAHELVLDDMEDKAEAEWKKANKESLEKRKEVVEKWTGEYEKVKRTYEDEVKRVYTDDGLHGDGNEEGRVSC